MNNYTLGIIWALGRYVDKTQSPNQYFFIRHNRKHFLEIVRQDLKLKSSIHTVTHRDKLQYRLKISGLDITEIQRLGWSPRMSEQRCYPNISGHKDFIRAYLEIHSSIDIVTIKRQRRRTRRQLRLRIYGNRYFLEQLNENLASETGTGIKKVQQATLKSQISGILYYQSLVELRAIFNYLYRPPVQYFDRTYRALFYDQVN